MYKPNSHLDMSGRLIGVLRFKNETLLNVIEAVKPISMNLSCNIAGILSRHDIKKHLVKRLHF